MSEWLLVPAVREHGETLAALHALSFPASWDRRAFEDLLSDPAVFGFIAAAGPESLPAGLGLARCAAGETEILTLSISPEERRQGLGRAVLQALIEAGERKGATSTFLEAAVDNHAALSLYRAAGFAPVGRRTGYYGRPDGVADAIIMRLSRP